MTSSNDSTKHLRWVDRGNQQYLYVIEKDNPYNTQIAKVYYQQGAVHASINKYADRYMDRAKVELAIAMRKTFLEQYIATKVAIRLDEANTGEI